MGEHMARADTTIGAWAAENTTVAEVERQLGRIVRELARPRDENGRGAPAGHLVPRTIVLNLLIHADDEGEAAHAAQAMAALATRHPSRTLLLMTAPDAAEDALDAAINTQCYIPPGLDGHLCFEQVRLLARGATALHLASVAEPLLVSNLPVYLWWLGRPPVSQHPLLELCDRLIVDSASFPDALAGLAVLDSDVQAEQARELGDLDWRRHAPWRHLVAGFFDAAEARPYQRRITHVQIEYAATASGGVGAAPLLLLGWLASRLNWQPEGAATAGGTLMTSFTVDHHAAGIKVRLRPRPVDDVAPGALLGVQLTADGGAAAARFEATLDAGAGWATSQVVIPGTREVTRLESIPWLTLAELLALELELPAVDPLYLEALALIARLGRAPQL
jgi:glucose-6-phosphate dehydrogenase assembly protein OpcA